MPLLYWRPLSNLFYQENMFELVLQQIGHRIVWYLLLTLFKKKKQRKNEGKINLEFIFQRFQTDSDPLNRVNRLTQVRLIAGLTVSSKLCLCHLKQTFIQGTFALNHLYRIFNLYVFWI